MRHACKCTDCGHPTVIEVNHRPAKGAIIKGLCTRCRRIMEDAIRIEGAKESVKRTQREARSE